SSGQVLLDLARLGRERLVRVVPTVVGTVEAQIDPVSGAGPRMVGDQVMDTQGGSIAAQDRVDLVTEPARVAHFDGPAVGARCSPEEVGEARQIWRPMRRQLDQDRPEAVAEPTRPLEESLDCGVGLLQALQVRTIAA